MTYTATADLSANSWRRYYRSAILDAQLSITYECTACDQPERPIEIQGLLGDGSWRTLKTQTFQDSEQLSVRVPYWFRAVRVAAPTIQADAYTTYAEVLSNTIPAPRGPR